MAEKHVKKYLNAILAGEYDNPKRGAILFSEVLGKVHDAELSLYDFSLVYTAWMEHMRRDNWLNFETFPYKDSN